MGEMTIRIDDMALVELQKLAMRRGADAADIAAELIRSGLRMGGSDRLAIADAIRARTGPSPVSSVELLDQIRDQGL